MRTLLLATLVALSLSVPFQAAAASRQDAPAANAAAKNKKKKTKRQRCLARAKKVRNAKKRRAAIRRCKKARPKRPAARNFPAAQPRVEGGPDDVVVVAVLDGGINPYHFDFLGSKMPQHRDDIAGNDLPLDRPPTEWIPGMAQAGFKQFERADLHLSDDPKAKAAELAAEDPVMSEPEESSADSVKAYWFPHTKVIGAVDFSSSGGFYAGNNAHGVGTTSSAVGNLHGTCPECLLFFVDYGDGAQEAEAAIDWVMKQPWIDAISNSYGFSTAVRDRVYAGSNTELQRAASERGQSVFFSAGNGNDGMFLVPNTTTYSSQEGPDWIITVGAVSAPDDGYYDPELDDQTEDHQSSSFVGAGKPADVAGVGNGYPTAYSANEIGATGVNPFGGTSNATPQVAGYYARGLYLSRAALRGPSRIQAGGIVATGEPVACAPPNGACELGDGKLTAAELRTRLFHGAVHTPAGMGVYSHGVTEDPSAPPVGEEEFLNEGHGSYMGRVSKDRDAWLGEFGRFFDPIVGTQSPLERPDGELEWMIVDSYCRQENWGSWGGGYYFEGQTQLPGEDPLWPMRSSRERSCPGGPTG